MWAYNAMHDPVRIDSLSSSEELENNGISVDPKRQRARPRQNDSFSLTTKTGRLVGMYLYYALDDLNQSALYRTS